MNRQTDRALLGYQATQSERDSLKDDDLITLNIKLPRAVKCGLLASRTIAKLRSQIDLLPGLDHARIHKLTDYTWALHYADSIYSAHLERAPVEPKLRAQGKAMRDQLLAQLELLEMVRLVVGRPSTKLRPQTSAINLAHDLSSLAKALRKAHHEVGKRMVLTLAELDAASTLSAKLLDAVAARGVISDELKQLKSERHRAFTLFARSYNQARRAVVFLRFDEGDADELVPLLYGERGGRGSDEAEAEGRGRGRKGVKRSVVLAAP
jgi:hypothetical protein